MVCRTFDEVVIALGGNSAIAILLGCSRSAVSGWRRNGRFPPRYYAAMAMALHERGYYAPWQLFGFAGIKQYAA